MTNFISRYLKPSPTSQVNRFHWPQYLNDLEAVEQDVHFRAYAQVDPFVAFRTEAARMFGRLMVEIELTAVRSWLSVQLPKADTTFVATGKKTGKGMTPNPKHGSSRKDKKRKQSKRHVPRRAVAPA